MKVLGCIAVIAVLLAAGCGGNGSAKTLSDAQLAAQVSKRLGPDGQGSTLLSCYAPRDGSTFDRVCYDPLVGTSAADALYIRVTGRSWCVVWPKAKHAPLCKAS